MQTYDIIIVGAGPAGSTAATVLAGAGVRTLLLEEKRMPRHKVCGEFITPESFATLERLNLMGSLRQAGARDISTVTLCAENGRKLITPIRRFSPFDSGLGLSRARLDHIMLDRARQAGAVCIEGAAVKQCVFDRGKANGVEALLLPSGKPAVFAAPLVIDASGRNSRIMADGAGRQHHSSGRGDSRLYAMKAHLEGVQGVDDGLELYFFRQGYGGISAIEDGLANVCFITTSQTLRSCSGDPMKVVESTLMKNPAARARLSGSRPVGKWLSVGPLTFGRKRTSRNGVIAIGDAAGMIDPFTGTGIQIALRTGEVLAQSVIDALAGHARPAVRDPEYLRGPAPKTVPSQGGRSTAPESGQSIETVLDGKSKHSDGRRTLGGIYESVLSSYQRRYDAEFGERMWAARMLRRAAFSVRTANAMGGVLTAVPWLGRQMIKATRRGA